MAHKDCMGYYKVINLFAATVMGLEGQISRRYKKVERKDAVIKDLEMRINIIQVARKPLSDAYAEMPKKFETDNLKRFNDIRAASTKDIVKVFNSLRKRWISAHKRNYKVQRDELSEYIAMLMMELDMRDVAYLQMPDKYNEVMEMMV
ncbi:hypothetical protein D3C76_1342160 [compost metagenome]